MPPFRTKVAVPQWRVGETKPVAHTHILFAPFVPFAALREVLQRLHMTRNRSLFISNHWTAIMAVAVSILPE